MYLKEKHPVNFIIMVLHIVKNIMEGKDKTIKDPEMPLSRGSFNLFSAPSYLTRSI